MAARPRWPARSGPTPHRLLQAVDFCCEKIHTAPAVYGRAGRRLAQGHRCQARVSLPGTICWPEAIQGFHRFHLADRISFFMEVADGSGNSSLMTARFAFLRCILQTPPSVSTCRPRAAKPHSAEWQWQLSPTHCKPHGRALGREAAPGLAWLSQHQWMSGMKTLPWSEANVVVECLSCLTLVL